MVESRFTLEYNQTNLLSTSHKIWSLLNFVAFLAHMDNSNRKPQIPNITLTPPGDKGQNPRGPYCTNACKNCHRRKKKCVRYAGVYPCENCLKNDEECVIRQRQRPGPKSKNDHDPIFQLTDGMLQNTNFQQQRNNIRRASSHGDLHRELVQDNELMITTPEIRRNSEGNLQYWCHSAYSFGDIMNLSPNPLDNIVPYDIPGFSPIISPGDTPSLIFDNMISGYVSDNIEYSNLNSPYSDIQAPPSPSSMTNEENQTDGLNIYEPSIENLDYYE
ncbi:12042_t:CDS:2 [Acaulospora morrowiae]|uniref:12042_t:CDS:1 n=1 Tax=Acaulospora morrowiae TaxID=94023 RepID=A0A9N9FN07_9GLOM|nr:12042_t:CDS:2 [Acaulospora morrowiae]